ncbi:hypothetical protein BDZ94DRAFT_33931 [Collybia nuda]|uniref:Uncharacterized protein n=1 Tax=Collybia nuda TaxID=64659 RepID=A0A9P5YIC1_9AGAR|nr:hypothetical protein BDZ94DRAFT_33931 [Collybia nuda]
MEHTLKRKVTVKFGYNDSSSRPPSRTNLSSRPPSPTKSVSSQSPITSPVIRARAKVNTSATPASARKPANSVSNPHVSSSTRSTVSTSSRPGTSATVTPRPTSPTKPPPRVRAGAPSPTFQPKARPTVRSHLRPTTPQPQPPPTTPELRLRSLTSASSDVGRFTPASRSRHGSVSLNHAVSFSSLQGSNLSSGSHSPPLRPTDTLAYSDNEGRHSPPVRIKAKISGLAKSAGDSLSPPPNGSLHTTARVQSRTRAPSTSSSVSMSVTPASAVPPSFYPITTATPAANPHRFATSRASPPQTANHYFQPFHQPHDDLYANRNKPNGKAKVDPTTIPLPATSPPASAVSFSSRSSVSRSSASYVTESVDSHDSVPTLQRHDDVQLRATLDNLMRYSEMNSREESYSGDSGQDRETDGELNTTERKVKAEAKSIRKIADLEITNRSLLAINASLETAKHKQAKEIRDLRRKLRESRLILPPRAYRAVKSSLDHDDTADEEDEDDEINEEQKDGDEVYRRIKILLEGLLDSGQRALVAKTEDFSEGGKGIAKVLNAEELRSWRDSNGGVSGHEPHTDKDLDGIGDGHHLSPSRIAIPDDDSDDDDFNSEEEVEAMTLTRSSTRSSPAPPPILITESP